jgi:hypothetical protein
LNLPNLRPPKLPPEETLRRLRLQKTGLASWPQDDGGTRMLYAWIEGEIFKAEQALRRAKKERN